MRLLLTHSQVPGCLWLLLCCCFIRQAAVAVAAVLRAQRTLHTGCGGVPGALAEGPRQRMDLQGRTPTNTRRVQAPGPTAVSLLCCNGLQTADWASWTVQLESALAGSSGSQNTPMQDTPLQVAATAAALRLLPGCPPLGSCVGLRGYM